MTGCALLAVLLGAAGADPLAPPPGAAPPADVAPPPAAEPFQIPGERGPAPAPAPPQVRPAPPAASPAPPPRTRQAALRVAVIDPKATGPIPARPLAAFSQSLVPELRKLEGVSAIGMAEVRDMLGFERQRQMIGCAADDRCLAEVAGSLGVDELVSVELVLVGKTYSLSMRRLDMRKAKVVQGDSRKFDRRDGEELLSIVGPAIAALFPERPLRPGKTRGIERSVIRRLNPPPLPRWVFVATAAGAATAAAAGGAYQVLASDARRDFDRLLARSRTEPVAATDLAAASAAVRSRESRRDVFLYAALGLGVAAGVEAFFTDWRNDRAAIVPIAAATGAGVVVAGRF